MRRPVRLPPKVEAILLQDSDIEETLKYDNLPPKVPASRLLTSEVHLNGPNEKDLMVIARGHLTGANVTRFWVFRPKQDGFEMIVNAVPAHDLVVKNTRTNGHWDIELWSATAVTVITDSLRFDGTSYQRFESKSEDIH